MDALWLLLGLDLELQARRDGVTHYSYGEGELAELSSLGRHRFIAHLLHRGEGLGRGYEVEVMLFQFVLKLLTLPSP